MKDNLIQRVITALIGVAILIPAIVLGPAGLWLFCVVVSIIGLWEFFRGMGASRPRYLWSGLGFGFLIWLLALAERYDSNIPANTHLIAVALLLPAMNLIALFDDRTENPIQLLGVVVLGYLYCFTPFFLFYHFGAPLEGRYDFTIPLGILFLTWTLDVSAYFAGKWFGNHPLFARISPKKTWEGAIVGGLMCIGMGAFMESFLPGPHSWFVIGLIIAPISQLGDLTESMFKRARNLKDSGGILPGHGGMLDRFDGFFFSLPFLYCYFWFL